MYSRLITLLLVTDEVPIVPSEALWKNIKAIMMNPSKKLHNIKEIWVPGFSALPKNNINAEKLQGSKAGANFISNVIKFIQCLQAQDIGECELYSPLPHEGGLIVGSTENFIIIKRTFLFGIYFFYYINRIGTR